ncbi:MAG TPA: hypothetical protein VJQ53_01350 [Candidatus Eisenbacteria bacterium]|nr:hypothetical protein [Candidatus Eisenbacteria bacterium]
MDRKSLPLRDAVAWALFAAFMATAFALATYPNVPPASDVWDYSQEARQLARGEGFTSLYTYPTHLGNDSAPFPVRWRMPLYAALGAALLKVGVPLPAGYFAIGIVSHALLVGLLFLLTTHLHSARAGAIAAAAAIASPLLLDPYSAALSQLPAAALALGVWLLLLRGSGALSACCAAVLAAAAWYLRGESLVMVPVWIWAACSGGRARRGAVFTLFYAALCIPWIIALRASVGAAAPIQGNPMLLYTAQYPGYSSARTYGEALPGMLAYATHHPAALLWRFIKDAAGYTIDLLWGLGPIAVGLGIAGLLLREANARWRSLAPALPLLIAAAIQIAAFSLLERSPRFLVPAVPLLCAALGIAAAPSLARFCGRRMVVAIFALLLLERGATLAFETREAARRFPPLPTTLAAEVAERIQAQPRSAILWTDVPDWIAWRLDRPALLLPLWRQTDRVATDHPTAGIFLSPNAAARNLADGEAEWARRIERGEPIPKFVGPDLLTDGARFYLPAR